MKLSLPSLPTAKCLANLLAILLLTVLSASRVDAAVLYEPFDTSPLDTSVWKVVKRNGNTAVVGVTTWSEGTGLLIARPASGAPTNGDGNSNAVVYYTGTQDDIQNGLMSDFSGSVTLSLGTGYNRTDSNRGVVLRAQSTAAYGLSGYYLTFNSNKLSLYENPSSHSANGTELAFDSISITLVANHAYRLDFSIIDSTVTGTLYDGTTVIATLTHDLSPAGEAYYADGYFGLRGAYQGEVYSYFSDLTLTTEAIPEPSTVALLAFALIGLCAWRTSHKPKGI